MAKAQQNQAVDLFGNPTLTPRQLMQQQLSALLEDTAAQTAGADPRTQGVSQMGAAVGGLLSKTLMEKGVIPMTPEMERAKRLQAARDATQQAAAEQGIDPAKNPGEFAELAASHFLRAGDEQAAVMALQYRDLHLAKQRAAEREQQQTNAAATAEAKDLSAFTPASRKAFVEGGRKDPSVLVVDPNAAGSGRGDYFIPVQTADGVKSFDARRGVILDPATRKPVTGPVVGSASDPTLQRNLNAGRKYGEKTGEEAAAVGGKLDALEAVGSATEMLDKGIYSGFWADWKMTAAKAGPGSKEKVANTEQFQAHIGNIVIPRLTEFGGNDSNEELKYLQKVMAGDIKMEEKALRKILESAERKIARGIARTRKRAQETGLPSDEETPAPKAEKQKPAASTLPQGWSVKQK